MLVNYLGTVIQDHGTGRRSLIEPETISLEAEGKGICEEGKEVEEK